MSYGQPRIRQHLVDAPVRVGLVVDCVFDDRICDKMVKHC